MRLLGYYFPHVLYYLTLDQFLSCSLWVLAPCLDILNSSFDFVSFCYMTTWKLIWSPWASDSSSIKWGFIAYSLGLCWNWNWVETSLSSILQPRVVATDGLILLTQSKSGQASPVTTSVLIRAWLTVPFRNKFCLEFIRLASGAGAFLGLVVHTGVSFQAIFPHSHNQKWGCQCYWGAHMPRQSCPQILACTPRPQMKSPQGASHTSGSTEDAQREELQLQDYRSLVPVRKSCQCWCWQQGWCYKSWAHCRHLTPDPDPLKLWKYLN